MDLRAAGVGASGDYRGDASCVEQANQEQRYPRWRYRGERQRRGFLRTLYQDRDQKTIASV
jgi:hypothetical protein